MKFCLIYMSKASKVMTDEDLIALLSESRDWNMNHDLTGMLLYIRSSLLNHHNGRFIQGLEGEKADVLEIFDKIKRDARHYDVLLLNQFDIVTRAFSDWTMGFETLDKVEFAKLPGGFDLDEDFFQKEPIEYAPVLDTLKSFYNLNKTFGR